MSEHQILNEARKRGNCFDDNNNNKDDDKKGLGTMYSPEEERALERGIYVQVRRVFSLTCGLINFEFKSTCVYKQHKYIFNKG